jgi:hypothetical protein
VQWAVDKVVHLRMRARAFTEVSCSLFDTDKPIQRNNQRVLGAPVRGKARSRASSR